MAEDVKVRIRVPCAFDTDVLAAPDAPDRLGPVMVPLCLGPPPTTSDAGFDSHSKDFGWESTGTVIVATVLLDAEVGVV